MDVKQAIAVAKSYVSTVYQEEGVFNIGLEEVLFDNGTWDVTIGFSRPWDKYPVAFLQQRQDKVIKGRYLELIRS